MKYFISISILFLLLFSCNKKYDKELITYTLFFDSITSSINKPFFRDSIGITYYGKDSILIKSYYNEYFLESLYFNSNNSLFEKRFVSNLPANIFELDTILTFNTKDTTFIYRTKRDDFIVTLVDVSLFDSRYNIARDGKNYKTTKQSLVDTTYKEILFYDKNYCIYKYINTWRGDKCVYVRK